ncbi:transmembrane protein [Elysia marginata]|uniref:Transmembrane protein n=1 Tax=Elysia marginata TaxID=1093978 RepID=A0AAV4H8M7_9GAST|nr:transmembrane protein [Elysia marginata]
MIGESCFNIIKALIVRAALALHTILTVWRVTENLYDQRYWLLCCLMIPFLVEGIYSIVRRQGKEYLWFSPCFFFYLCATLPPIWLLELDKSEQVREEEAGLNHTFHNETLNKLAEKIPVSLNPNMWTIVIEEMLLYLLVIGRWILPRGEVTREQLSELLFAFIGIAADVMEFFSLFGENHVRTNEILGYCLLGIWSLSILQFTMAVTVTQQPKRAKKIKTVRAKGAEPEENQDSKLSSELGAIFISMVMQDVPFLVLRLYTIITYNLINYSLIFFTSKNVLVISLLFYKIAVLLQMRYCPEKNKEKDEDDEKVVGGYGGYVGGRGKGDGDDESVQSSPSKYALPYEYAGMAPATEKGSLRGSSNQNGGSELTKRSTSKSSADTRSNRSMDTKKASPDSRPIGLTLTSGNDKERRLSPGSALSPSASHGKSSGVSPNTPKSSPSSVASGTPKPLIVPEVSEKKESPKPERPSQLDSPKEFNEPVIITPTPQTAQPGDPDFQPYTSVVKLP